MSDDAEEYQPIQAASAAQRRAAIAAMPVVRFHTMQLFWTIVFANLTSGAIGGVIAAIIINNS